MLIRLFMFLLLSGLVSNSSAHAAVPRNLQLEVEVRGELFELRVKNISSHVIALPDFGVDDGKRTGYWVYLYDKSTRRLIHPSAMYQLPPSHQAEVPQKFNLRRGQVKTFSEPLAEILKFFGAPNRCNWLVIVYARHEPTGLVRSSPTSPTLVCSQGRT